MGDGIFVNENGMTAAGARDAEVQANKTAELIAHRVCANVIS